MLDQVASEVARAQQDAASYFHKPKTFSPKQVARSEAYAHAALDELERQQRAAPGVLHSLIEGGGVSARGLNLEDYHGLREVVQNADDLGASQVRFALRSHVGHLQLLVLHDGDPVELTDVLPMTYAFFSTKRDNPRKKGRFTAQCDVLRITLASELEAFSEARDLYGHWEELPSPSAPARC